MTERSVDFYARLFGWAQVGDMDMGEMTYTMIKVGEGTGGGLSSAGSGGGERIGAS